MLRIFKLLLVYLLLFCSCSVFGQDVQILYDSTKKHHHQFLAILKTNIEAGQSNFQVIEYTLEQMQKIDKDKLLVTVGHHAATYAKNFTGTVFHTFNSKRSLNKIYSGNIPDNRVFLILDQPLKRYFQLIKTALGNDKKLGVLVGEQSAFQISELESYAEIYQFSLLVFNTLSGDDTFNDIVEDAIGSSDALLLVPDPEVINKTNARSIILGSYKRHVPLVGFSKSLVKAGALMAVYTEPEQVAVQSLKIIKSILNEHEVNTEFTPDDFNVAVNYQLARALGLRVESEAEIKKQMLEGDK
jgi:ABC-type uncharacterized transport system substrate-binding protein